MYLGAVLLAVTFMLNQMHSDAAGFNYAYVTGIAMLAAFVASLAIFTKDKMKKGLAS